VFAYPYGDYSNLVLQEMAASPYHYGFTVENGTATVQHHPHKLPRYTMLWHHSDPIRLRIKLYRHKLIHLSGKARQV
jgi:hypothetical protein